MEEKTEWIMNITRGEMDKPGLHHAPTVQEPFDMPSLSEAWRQRGVESFREGQPRGHGNGFSAEQLSDSGVVGVYVAPEDVEKLFPQTDQDQPNL